jgi:hypothetical protein
MKCGKLTTVAIILCIQAWTPCSANLSLQSGPSRYCVDAGGEEFVCSDDPYVTRLALDSVIKVSQGTVEEISRGVAQRIDGTELEQNAIREILSMTDRYYLEEVLSKPAYAGIRTKWYVPFI